MSLLVLVLVFKVVRVCGCLGEDMKAGDGPTRSVGNPGLKLLHVARPAGGLVGQVGVKIRALVGDLVISVRGHARASFSSFLVP